MSISTYYIQELLNILLFSKTLILIELLVYLQYLLCYRNIKN